MTLLTSTPYHIIYYLLYFLPVFALDFPCSRTAVWVTSHNICHVECSSTTISIFNWNILIVIMTAKRGHYGCISELFFGDHMKCVLKTFNIWIRGGGPLKFHVLKIKSHREISVASSMAEQCIHKLDRKDTTRKRKMPRYRTPAINRYKQQMTSTKCSPPPHSRIVK